MKPIHHDLVMAVLGGGLLYLIAKDDGGPFPAYRSPSTDVSSPYNAPYHSLLRLTLALEKAVERTERDARESAPFGFPEQKALQELRDLLESARYLRRRVEVRADDPNLTRDDFRGVVYAFKSVRNSWFASRYPERIFSWETIENAYRFLRIQYGYCRVGRDEPCL